MADDTTLVSLEGLEAVARAVWEELEPGGVVWLTGDLGSGKTTFARALTRAAGAALASSPTYALVHRYESASGPIIHVDCYRLQSADEALDLDLHELQRQARLVLVEWPERAGDHAPPPDAHLEFAHQGDPNGRIIRRLR